MQVTKYQLNIANLIFIIYYSSLLIVCIPLSMVGIYVGFTYQPADII